MFCSNCGKQLAENAKFCDGCGAKQGEAAQSIPQNAQVENAPKAVTKSKIKLIIGSVLVMWAAVFIIWPIFFPSTMSMCDDGLDKTEILSLIICVVAFGAPGAWLIYKNKK